MRNGTTRGAPKNAAGRARDGEGKGTGMKGPAIAQGANGGKLPGRFLPAHHFYPVIGCRRSLEDAKSEPKAIGWEQLISVSPNAFKGKGALWWLRRIEEEINSVSLLMDELISITHSVAKTGLRCMLLRYKDGRKILRWRRHGDSGSDSLTIKHARELVSTFPEPERSWYLRAIEQGVVLTERHRILMGRRRELLKQLPTAPVYMRDPTTEFNLHPVAQKRCAILAAAIAQ